MTRVTLEEFCTMIAQKGFGPGSVFGSNNAIILVEQDDGPPTVALLSDTEVPADPLPYGDEIVAAWRNNGGFGFIVNGPIDEEVVAKILDAPTAAELDGRFKRFVLAGEPNSKMYVYEKGVETTTIDTVVNGVYYTTVAFGDDGKPFVMGIDEDRRFIIRRPE